MITRCSVCGRAFMETDARRVDAPRPVCVSCLIDAMETDADARGQFRTVADALRAIAAVPVSWYRGRTAHRLN